MNVLDRLAVSIMSKERSDPPSSQSHVEEKTDPPSHKEPEILDHPVDFANVRPRELASSDLAEIPNPVEQDMSSLSVKVEDLDDEVIEDEGVLVLMGEDDTEGKSLVDHDLSTGINDIPTEIVDRMELPVDDKKVVATEEVAYHVEHSPLESFNKLQAQIQECSKVIEPSTSSEFPLEPLAPELVGEIEEGGGSPKPDEPEFQLVRDELMEPFPKTLSEERPEAIVPASSAIGNLVEAAQTSKPKQRFLFSSRGGAIALLFCLSIGLACTGLFKQFLASEDLVKETVAVVADTTEENTLMFYDQKVVIDLEPNCTLNEDSSNTTTFVMESINGEDLQSSPPLTNSGSIVLLLQPEAKGSWNFLEELLPYPVALMFALGCVVAVLMGVTHTYKSQARPISPASAGSTSVDTKKVDSSTQTVAFTSLVDFDALIQFHKSFRPRGKGRKTDSLKLGDYPKCYSKLTMDELKMIITGLSPSYPKDMYKWSKFVRVAKLYSCYSQVLAAFTKAQLVLLLDQKGVTCKKSANKSELVRAALEAGF
eukprot:CAMPEP_0172452750 /NCGR_PEP_ID=MMETSP1065-20121228/10316_1 /TAXON_ID=265537 /ORGANISM="Amphiprora paludosa, Strain CCMP125" /LENGTH=538 /DNA_ID=CAMNT_0013204855 /DNA_START=21 /DNA_END=1637 /DNA_ORIENTATION=+